MTEAELQACVRDAATKLRWMVYHTHDSRRSDAGFPDLVLVRRNRVMYRELKRGPQPSLLTFNQLEWLHGLRAAYVDVDVWNPDDWPARIIEDLRSSTPLGIRPLPPVPTAPKPRRPRPADPAAVRAAYAARGAEIGTVQRT